MGRIKALFSRGKIPELADTTCVVGARLIARLPGQDIAAESGHTLS